jgi:hypothetical protein
MKRTAKMRERRVFTFSRHHQEAARLPEQSAARDRDNRKVEKGSRNEEHRRQGHNKFGRNYCSRLALPSRRRIHPHGDIAPCLQQLSDLHRIQRRALE